MTNPSPQENTQELEALRLSVSEFIVDIFEEIGDVFAPKKREGSPERVKLLKLIGDIHPYRERLEKAIQTYIDEQLTDTRNKVLGEVKERISHDMP